MSSACRIDAKTIFERHDKKDDKRLTLRPEKI